MRSFSLAALALAVALGLHGVAAAQQRGVPKVVIDEGGVRLGYPGASEGNGFKTGFWAPVYVQITAGPAGRVGPADGSVVVSTTDSDDMENVYRVPLPPLEPKEQATVLTYVRTGSTGSEVYVSIKSPEGKTLAQQRAGKAGIMPAPPGAFLYLVAGADSMPLRRALRPQKTTQEEGAPPGGDVGGEDVDLLTTFAHVRQEPDLPTRWFGYDSADVVVLETGGNARFVEDLLADRNNRKEALAEWVRRGGRLVITVGHNHQLVNGLLGQLGVLGVTLEGADQRPSLDSVSRWSGTRDRFTARPRRQEEAGKEPAAIELANIKVQPGKGVQPLLEEGDGADRKPVIVEAPAGLGRVVLVGFDVDRSPFLDWEIPTRGAFWQKLDGELRSGQARDKAGQANQAMMGGGVPGWDQTHSDVLTLLQDRLESFNEVPVISFGWVALFILLYIVVVGPLDYFFLKKVVKRLELTWITFPTVVLVVSALAYVSAYYLKGNDLRVNKVDVVDVVAEPAEGGEAGGQAQGARAYGTTWFTVFSPRIQNYTVGVEPAAGAWVPELAKPSSANPHSVVVSWMGRPENSYGGTGRAAGSPGLFRRAYEYAPDASGLVGVPIQVWSTKSFTASWQAALPEDRPLFRSELRVRGRSGEQLTGSLTSALPVDLEDAVLLYRNTRYPLQQLRAGETRRLEPVLVVGGAGNPEARLDDYFSRAQPVTNYNPVYVNPRYGNGITISSADGIIPDLLFGDKDTNGGHPRNTTLRRLEESWRLNVPGEAVVVGRVRRVEDAAEKASLDPASPSRLWLGRLPDEGEPRPPLPGKLSQETYVRVFLPVATK